MTNPDEPSLIEAVVAGETSGYTVIVGTAGTGDRTMLAFCGDQIRSPLKLETNQVSSWRSEGNHADLVIITHRTLKASLAPLVALRQSQGLRVATVDIEDIYDEFNFGNASPKAIKDFLAYARLNWKKTPRYVLLVGTASYDPKNYNGFGSYDLVPTKLIDTLITETASDDWFGDFDLNGNAKLAIGRLPSNTPEETTNMVAKLIAYESMPPQNSALLVADDNLGFDFEGANDLLAPLFPIGITVRKIKRGQIGTSEARQLLLDEIATGQKVVNYVGHGSPGGWKASLLTTADALSLNNAGRYPMFVLMTCLNGQFHHPQLNTLATGLMNARQGGAIAVWASSGLTEAPSQATMNQRFYRELFQLDQQGHSLRLGDAVFRAKSVIDDLDVRRTWILFGDPSMRLR
jgi:Peptidase family C25